jgi:hypothetical protein
MRLRVLYHGNCFDGCSSAGLFTRFFRERIAGGAPVDVAFAPLEHRGAGPAIPEQLFDGDANVCVDFRYSQDPRLNWWFDHHISAFQAPGDEAHFRADTSGKKFYDPTARSCARFLARTAAEKFGFDTGPLTELIEWAEIIDGALFPTPQMPVELKEPALRLMTWVENNRSEALAVRFIEDLVSRPLAEIAASPYVSEPLGPILEQHATNIESVRRVARMDGDVVVTDFLDQKVGSLNKFIVYYLHPEARYSVTLLPVAGGTKTKIGVGSNPWSPVPRSHNIAGICERYGGGGHPVVGAITLTGADAAAAAARKVAAEVIATLKS